jgi:hypothetical protein
MGREATPDDVEALKAALIVARAEAAAARAQQSDDQALIAHLKLQIEKLNRDRYGPRSERTARLGRDHFDIQWHRHTGTWFCLHRGLSLVEALKTIENDGLLHPL